MFDLIRHLVDSNLLQRWRRVSKSVDPIKWAIPLRRQLCLVMPAASLATVLAVKTPEGLQNANTAMMQCIDAGSEIAERLFASCVEKAVESRVQIAMEEVIKAFFAFKPEAGKLTFEHVDKLRSDMLTSAKDVSGNRHTYTNYTQTF